MNETHISLTNTTLRKIESELHEIREFLGKVSVPSNPFHNVDGQAAEQSSNFSLICIGSVWDFSLKRNVEQESPQLVQRLSCIVVVPEVHDTLTRTVAFEAAKLRSHLVQDRLISTISVNKSHALSKLFAYRVSRLENWHMGDPPPVDFYEHIVSILNLTPRQASGR